jgi:hypothetical protein
MSINNKSLKKDIYIAYLDLKDQQKSQTITKTQAINTARLVAKEAQLLVRDCRIAGSVAAQWISRVVDELRQPVLRSY